MSYDIRPFPIMEHVIGRHTIKGFDSEAITLPACTIPWWLAEAAFKTYIRLYGRCQTLERIAERGGFERDELLDLLKGQVLQGR